MPALCILAAGKMTVLAASLFSLSWAHSVQKTEWRETWAVTPDGLVLEEARVKGSGAGMDPPEDAVFEDGWWVYRPNRPPLPSLTLAASGATGGGWTLCAEGQCLSLGETAGAPITVAPCDRPPHE
jgi:Uncharacterized conserved protein